MRSLSRLVPPRVPRTPELRWVLLRAFGPLASVAPARVDGALGAELATRFDLAARIAERTDPARLAEELGDGAAGGLRSAMRACAGRALLLREAAADLASRSRRLGGPAVFLKGFALEALGITRTGSRFLGDLDVLMDDGPRVALLDELRRDGWSSKETTAADHQEVPLISPDGAMVELHRYVPGVRRAGADRDLRAADFILPETGGARSDTGIALPDLAGAFVPAPHVLLAHALVHGLVQHGTSPKSYPLFRWVADAADLLAAEPGLATVGFELEGLDDEDVAVALGLVRRLVAGEDVAEERETRLLDHLVAGALLSEYAAALKSDLVGFAALGDRSPGRTALARAFRTAFVLRDEDVDAIYGAPASRLGYVGRRLARPFDLAIRYVKSRAAARRLRRTSTTASPGSK